MVITNIQNEATEYGLVIYVSVDTMHTFKEI